jgi:hypothetical protein
MRKSFARSAVAVLTLLVMLVQGTWVLAGTTGRLSGTVTDAGAPVAGATVAISSPSQSASATTDQQGRFAFLSLAPDTYTVTISKAGYQTLASAGVTIQADQSADLTFPVSRTLRQIGSTTSRASTDVVRPGQTQDVYSVNAGTQTTVQALGGGGNLNNAYSAIASVPGVVVPYGGAGWGQVTFIHGASYSQVGYEFDGIPVNRAFDNYNSNTLSNLGQQELQVVTSGSTAASASATVAGLISQVIRTGTYPGTKNLSLGLGSPTKYNSTQFDIGGSTPSRSFSYYFGVSGYDQNYRYGDQFNGGLQLSPAFLSENEYTTTKSFPQGIYSPCDATGSSTAMPPGGYDPGCALYNQLPFATAAIASVRDREGIANLHFGLPHRSGDGRDDIQVLYSGSYLLSKDYTSINDQQPLIGNLLNLFGVTPTWGDGYYVNAPFGAPAAGVTKQQYFFPSSPTGRAFQAPFPADIRDGTTNDSEIVKVQYQKNFANSYLRIFGYTSYSDWLQNAPAFGALAPVAVVAPISRDYELIAHTRGGEIQFATQLNPKNQAIATLNYVTAGVVRDNNSEFTNANGTAVSNYTNGSLCYSKTTGAIASCYSSATTGTFANPNPAVTVPVAGASFVITDPGPKGTYNTVAPKFLTASITDEIRPNDKLVANLGLRLERFEYDRTPTNSADYTYWFNQAANTFCYDLRTQQPLFAATKPGVANTQPTLAQGYNNTCGVAGAGPTGRVDPATGDPVGNPNGQFGTTAYTGVSAGTLVRQVLEPRLGATYSVNPDTVIRGSAGLYSTPFNTATVQYLNLSAKGAASFDFQNFFGFGFNSPTHDFDPSKSYNLDLSLEKHIRGTDMSYKISPFYRYTKNQYQDFLIGPGFVSSIPTGNETAYGLELQFRKGDPSRNGLSGQLSYTYTNAFMKFNQLANGTNVVTPVNQTVDQFNALTAVGNRAGQTGAPCYVPNPGGLNAAAPAGYCTPTGGANNTPALTAAGAAAGAIVNPYYNMSPAGYFNEGAPYPVYQTFPSANGADGSVDIGQTIAEPHAFSGFLNYRHDRFTAALAGTATIGNPSANGFARYGSPYDVIGQDPRTCYQNQQTAGIASAQNPGLANWASCEASIGQYGALYIPNPQTGHFDGFGEFRAPWLVNLNLQFGYDFSKRVHANLVLANVLTRCFGGSKTPWSTAYPANGQVCTYLPNPGYVSNFYNGSGPLDAAANGIASPAQNLQSFGAVGSALPFQAFFQLQLKL